MNTQPRHPKCRALPVEPHPDIQFLSLYHDGWENQRFFCLWSFLWSKPLLRRFRQSKKTPQTQASQGFAAFHLTPSRIPPRHTQIKRATNCAIPGYSISVIIPRRGRKSKIFLSVVIPVVKAAFVPFSATGGNPANAGVTRLCGVSSCPIPDSSTALPNVAPYQLSHTRIFSFCHDTTARGKNKDFSVCGHLCGQSRFYGTFGNQGKSRKRRRHKALRRFVLPCPGYRHGTPKAGALPTALHPVISLFYPAGRILPNLSGILFLLVYSGF